MTFLYCCQEHLKQDVGNDVSADVNVRDQYFQALSTFYSGTLGYIFSVISINAAFVFLALHSSVFIPRLISIIKHVTMAGKYGSEKKD